MKKIQENIHAVLTGDVVNSTRLPLAQRTYLATVFTTVGESIRKRFGRDLLPLGMETIRGDSFQTLISRPELALRLALLVRAAVRSNRSTGFAGVRIAIGIGAVEFVGNRVSEGLGPAYELSGKRLDNMKRDERMGVDCGLTGFDTDTWNIVLRLMDALVEPWTPKQAAAVHGALQGLTQHSIAQDWDTPVKQQTVGNHLKRGGWGALRHVIDHFENSIKRLY